MNSIRAFTIIVFLFFLIFNPPLINGINFTVWGVIISGIICLFHPNQILFFLKNYQIRKILYSFLVFIFYVIVISLINYYISDKKIIIESLVQTLRYHASIMVVSFAVIIIAKINKLSINGLLRFYVFSGLWQALIGIACLMIPSVRNFFISLILKNSNMDRLVMLIEAGGTARNYGFAYMLYDMFGISMAILSILAFVEGMKGRRIYYIYFLLMAVVAVINARSAFIILVVGLLTLTLIPHNRNVASSWLIKRIASYMMVSIVLFYLFSFIIKGTSEQAIWLSQGIVETSAFVQGKNIGYYDVLFNHFIFFPDDIFSTLFGTGLNSAEAVQRGTDVGYVMYLWYYGIVGSFIYYRLYYLLFKSAYKSLVWPYNRGIFAITVMVALYLIKLTCLGYSMAAVIFMPLALYAVEFGIKTEKGYESVNA